MAALLGIDNGLTVTKAVIFDTDGHQLAVAKKSIPQLKPAPHFVERNMDALWNQTAKAIKQALLESKLSPSEILAVSVTAHGDGLYLLDKDKRPLGNGILSLDSRAQSQVTNWDQQGLSKTIREVSGQKPHASSPAALLSWIQQNDPPRFEKIAHIISSKDWLRFRLTGEIATDHTEASTAFTNVQTQSFSEDVVALYGLGGKFHALPRVLHSAEVAGAISREAAAETGLRVGTPVATGLHDVTASALGIGAHSLGDLGIVAGTYSINEVVADAPISSPGWFCRNAIEPGQWNNMAISPSSTANYEWFIETFCKEELQRAQRDGSTIHDLLGVEIDEAFDRNAPVIFHPYLYGSPFGADASASFVGLRGWHERGDIIAAILQGIAFNHRHHVDDLKRSFEFQTAHLTGGASRNPRVAQLFADVLGMSVKVPWIDEAAAWGAALCAGKAVNLFDSISQTAKAIATDGQTYEPRHHATMQLEERYTVYREIADGMAQSWEKLERIEKQSRRGTLR